jgi:ubiquinol-cytochrome c reductase cytochrome b subunit
LYFLHDEGSNNPLGFGDYFSDKVPFLKYFLIKDIFGVVVFFIIYVYFVTECPNKLGHFDNYIEAMPLVTPTHIVPE